MGQRQSSFSDLENVDQPSTTSVTPVSETGVGETKVKSTVLSFQFQLNEPKDLSDAVTSQIQACFGFDKDEIKTVLSESQYAASLVNGDNNELLSVLLLQKKESSQGDLPSGTYIWYFCCPAPHCGKGYGQKLITWLKKWMLSNPKKIHWPVRFQMDRLDSDESTIVLFKNLGFKPFTISSSTDTEETPSSSVILFTLDF